MPSRRGVPYRHTNAPHCVPNGHTEIPRPGEAHKRTGKPEIARTGTVKTKQNVSRHAVSKRPDVGIVLEVYIIIGVNTRHDWEPLYHRMLNTFERSLKMEGLKMTLPKTEESQPKKIAIATGL